MKSSIWTLLLALWSLSLTAQSEMYWMSPISGIEKATLDGAERSLVVPTGLVSPYGIDFDAVEQKLYWTDTETNALFRSNLDGSQMEQLAHGLDQPAGLTLDRENQRVYWGDLGSSNLYGINTDGTERVTLTESAGRPQDLSLDATHGYLYVADDPNDLIYRIKTDGSGKEYLLSPADGIYKPCDIELDVANGKMYWVNLSAAPIMRANLDGTEVDTLLHCDAFCPAFTLELDLAAGKIYFFQEVEERQYELRRMNLDGSGLEVLYYQFDQRWDLADLVLDIARQRLYLSNQNTATIEVFDLNSRVLQPLFSPLQPTLRGFEVDAQARQLYWTDAKNQGIYRANLDGSEATKILSTPAPDDLALDVHRALVYWSNSDQRRIHRANLDGTNIQVFYEDPTSDDAFSQVYFDAVNDQVYWLDEATQSIYQANLEGEVVKHLDFQGNPISDFVVDASAGKIYWTDPIFRKIKRANLADGSDLEEVHQHLNSPSSLDLDLTAGKMYWVGQHPSANNNVWRSNLDGSEVETLLFSDLVRTEGIRLLLATSTATSALNEAAISLAPNPTSDFLFLRQLPPQSQISIYNSRGQALFHQRTTDTTYEINTSDLLPGAYHLEIRSGEKRWTHTFVKM